MSFWILALASLLSSNLNSHIVRCSLRSSVDHITFCDKYCRKVDMSSVLHDQKIYVYNHILSTKGVP